MRLGDRGLGVYVHYPYCRHRCPYCDFAIAVDRGDPAVSGRYTDAVLAELEARAAQFRGHALRTIYLGGGTPSLWPLHQLERVLERVTTLFPGAPREVTLEANPIDCTSERLAAWRSLGITRLSIGVQSVHSSDLATLGRDHRMGEARSALDACRDAGFSTYSADLMISVPGGLRDPGVAELADRGVPHVSVYELTIEDRTPLAASVARGEVAPLPESERESRYLRVHDTLLEHGYEHYEVSSFAKPGHRGVHNAAYWQAQPCLAVGNGAASLFVADDGRGQRTINHRSVGRYLAARVGGWAAESEDIDAQEMARDRIWLGLRTREGVEENLLTHTPGLREWLVEHGLATAAEGRIRPTFRGYLQHDAVVRRVVTCFRYTHPESA